MDIQHNGAAPERVDFSKIKTSIPIPNLIEVQKKSYERFLQMDLLPNEREDIGLQTVFNSVFPISDFRGVSELEFVDYSIGNWECKCGNLKGLHHLRSTCRNCGATIRTDPFHAGDILCHHCGTFNKNVVTFCNKCGDPVGLQLKYDMQECQERGMTYAAPLKVTIRLTVYAKDPGDAEEERPGHQGAGSLLRRNSADDGQRHVHHQRHRARDRLAVAPFAGRVLRARAGAGLLPGQDHSLSRKLGGIRVRQQEHPVRPYRPQAQVLRLGIPARAGLKTDEQILRAFYRVSKISVKDKKLLWNVDEGLTGLKLSYAITAKSGETVVGQGKKITPRCSRKSRRPRSQQVEVAANDLEGAYVVADVVDMSHRRGADRRQQRTDHDRNWRS